MPITLLLRVAVATVIAAACVQSADAAPPGTRATIAGLGRAAAAKRAEAQRVLAEIWAVDEQLNTASERYDGARYRLGLIRARLDAERASYRRAKAAYARAERRAAKLLVWLYTSTHADSLDVILGAASLSDLLRLADDESAVSHQATVIAAQTDRARKELRARVVALDAARAAQAAAVAELERERFVIARGLAERERLLISVEAQVAHLEMQQRTLQAKLAAEARARLAAEAAAREAAQHRAEVAARLAAAKAARQKAAALRASTEVPAPPPPPTTTAAAPTDTTTTAAATTPAVTTPPLPTVTTPALPPIPTVSPAPSTMPVPAGPLPVGYTQAASIALGYLGVPYVWGGESPSGFDCSGLVAYVYAQLGVALPHYAAAQYTYGVAVPESQLQPGDLVFFANLNHVGIYIGNGQFVNAPHTGAFVEIDSLSTPWFSAHYVGARRL